MTGMGRPYGDDWRRVEDTDDIGDASDLDDTEFTMVDPVCGNRVEMTSLFTATYRGRSFIFDTAECRETFLASPEAYVAAA